MNESTGRMPERESVQYPEFNITHLMLMEIYDFFATEQWFSIDACNITASGSHIPDVNWRLANRAWNGWIDVHALYMGIIIRNYKMYKCGKNWRETGAGNETRQFCPEQNWANFSLPAGLRPGMVSVSL